VCPDDEARFFFDLESARPDHRVHSLCRQAQEAVSLAFAEAAADERLDGAWIASVDPLSGPGRLVVSVVLPPGADGKAVDAAWVALREMAPWVRSEVARAIHRKRVPELSFRVLVDVEAKHE
jgi:ribosome-binding factor A